MLNKIFYCLVLILLVAAIAFGLKIQKEKAVEIDKTPLSADSNFNMKNVKPGYQKKITADDIECLAVTIFYEANKESKAGQEAVAYVVLNRSNSVNYTYGKSTSIYDIVTAPYQFSWVKGDFESAKDRANELGDWKKFIPMVKDILKTYHVNNSPVGDATHFINEATATGRKWWEEDRMTILKKIGNHTFLKVANEKIAIPGNS